MHSKDAKGVILNAVMELISQKPLNRLSVREIAQKAKMNSAAINYYFGSKEILFNETMHYYWRSLCEIYERIMTEKDLTPQTVHSYCKEIMYFYIKSCGILRSEQSIFNEQGMDEDTKQRIEIQIKSIGYIILSFRPQTHEDELMVKVIRFISSLAHPALFAESFNNIAPKGKTLEDFLDNYITDLIINI